jgi:hypothetical protein
VSWPVLAWVTQMKGDDDVIFLFHTDSAVFRFNENDHHEDVISFGALFKKPNAISFFSSILPIYEKISGLKTELFPSFDH